MAEQINKIGLALRTDNELAASVFEELVEVLLTNKVELSYISAEISAEISSGISPTTDKPRHKNYDFPLLKEQDIAKHCQAILVVGGDGTFIRYFMHAAKAKVPILGINCGRVGFLTELARKDIKRVVPEILQGDYSSSTRIIMKGLVKQGSAKTKELHSINDLVIHSLSGRMMEAQLMIDGKFVYCERSDGIIVATSAGSSAYALSAGGPLIAPTARAIEVVNISPHNMTSRPLVLSDNSTVKIELVSEDEVAVYADGHNQINISKGAVIEIAKDDLEVPLIHHYDYDIFSAYRSKLGWHSTSEGSDK